MSNGKSKAKFTFEDYERVVEDTGMAMTTPLSEDVRNMEGDLRYLESNHSHQLKGEVDDIKRTRKAFKRAIKVLKAAAEGEL